MNATTTSAPQSASTNTGGASTPPPRANEVRIGLVLYGGVSLAVYINGVAQEFFRAVRGEGVYRLLKALLNADIVVDVISGTSAGGLNGIYLAYALCQPDDGVRNFLQFSDLWRNHGDIAKLLRKPGAPDANSVLDGEGYYQDRLQEAFGNLDPWKKEGQQVQEEPSTVSELDLFITSTDFYGSVYTRFDDTGRPITVKDHHSVFRLKYRAGRYSDFGPHAKGQEDPVPEETRHEQLAKLARMTSCFPVAFPPVEVTGKDDDLICKWGYLDKKAEAPGEHQNPPARYYIDGGVLDNKPFSYTIGAIFGRTGERPAIRKLYYVEPVPEVFKEGEKHTSPDVIRCGVSALTEIPGYESIAGDLRDIRNRNSRLSHLEKLTDKLSAEGAPAPGDLQRKLYRQSRINVLLERVLSGLLRQNGRETMRSPEEQELAARLYQNFFQTFGEDPQPDGDRPPIPLDEVLAAFDVQMRLRRLFHMTYQLRDLRPKESDPEAQALRDCNQWIKCAEVVYFAMQSLVDRMNIAWHMGDGTQTIRDCGEIWDEVGAALMQLLNADDAVEALLQSPPQQPQLSALLEILKSRVDQLVKGQKVFSREALEQNQRPNLVRRLDRVLGGDPATTVGRLWREFENLDAWRFPLQAAAGFFELDQIETVRISPRDAKLGFSDRKAPEKLSGDQFANFGGFFKRSWRSNDILWGQLDGRCRIFESLLTPKAVGEAVAADPGGTIRRKELIASLGLPEHVVCWLNQLADPHDPGHADSLKELAPERSQKKNSLLSQLVEALQKPLIDEGLKKVLEDSIEEQVDWNHCSVGDEQKISFHADGLRFSPPNSGFIGIAAQILARDSIKEVASIYEFFKTKYAVGSESMINDIPKPVLIEVASGATLVLRDCLVPQIEKHGVKVRSSPVYRFGFDWPVRLTHGFAELVRYAPTTARVITWVLFVYSVAALFVGIKYWTTFISPAEGFQMTPFLALVAFPVAYLFALPEMIELYPRTQTRRAALWRVLAAVVLVALAAGVGYVAYTYWEPFAGFINRHSPAISAVLITAGGLLVIHLLASLGQTLWRKMSRRKRS